VALSRVLLNLTTNALKFTSEGYVELRGDQGVGNTVQFSVRDTGRGIPPHAMLTLFEPFRRRQKQGEYAFSAAQLHEGRADAARDDRGGGRPSLGCWCTPASTTTPR
jgi:signal transduction histidine kinase